MDNPGKAFLGRGWAFPIRLESLSGHIETVRYEEDIEQSIAIILGTAKGERVMRSDFGCGIHDLVFAAINRSLVTRVEQAVREALAKYEARIDVDDVSVDAADAVNGRLLISIDYQVRATNQPGNFVYPFYFNEAF